MIYFDSAATSYLPPESVALAVAEAIRHMGNSSREGCTVRLWMLPEQYTK